MSVNSLITECLNSNESQPLLRVPDEFLAPIEKKWVDWIRDYRSRYGVTPTLDRMQQEFASFVDEHTGNPPDDEYDMLIEERRNIYARTYLHNIQQELIDGNDPRPYIQHLQNVLNSGTADVLRWSEVDRQKYFEQLTPYRFGVQRLDEVTGGVLPGDLCYFTGRPASGKTTISEWFAKNWVTSGLKVGFVSNENAAIDILHKVDSMIGGWNPIRKRTGGWTESEKRRVRAQTYISSSTKGDIIVPERKLSTVDEVNSFLETYRPELLIIDGVYLMHTPGERGWESLTSVSRGLKALALRFELPIIGILQLNRGAEGKTHIERDMVAFTDAFLQDADLMLSIAPLDDGNAAIETMKNRWGGEAVITANTDYDNMLVSSNLQIQTIPVGQAW